VGVGVKRLGWWNGEIPAAGGVGGSVKRDSQGMFRSEAEVLLGLLANDREDIVKKGLVWMRNELAR